MYWWGLSGALAGALGRTLWIIKLESVDEIGNEKYSSFQMESYHVTWLVLIQLTFEGCSVGDFVGLLDGALVGTFVYK